MQRHYRGGTRARHALTTDLYANRAVTVAPILPARDFEATARFYEGLGFTVVSQYQPPDAYLILRRGEVELHFFPHFDLDPATSYAGCYIRVTDVET